MPVLKQQPWQEALSSAITDPSELLQLLALDPKQFQGSHLASENFQLKVTHSYIKRMRKGDPNDPLLKQVLPLKEELNLVPGYIYDPLEEINANPVPGLLHKYFGRVLVTLTQACAIHCRYCFRRHFPYAENNPGRRGWDAIFAYIADHPSITEVILSGGDPLSVNDKVIGEFTSRLSHIRHVERLRIHTRIPVILPERITDNFLYEIKKSRLKLIMVLHVNHPNEIDDDVRKQLRRLKSAGFTLLNQTVLLRGVNDDVEVLKYLSEKLFDANVLPYYLHTLDKVQGSAHFDVSREAACSLYYQLGTLLPGYLVPKLVSEVPYEEMKTLLMPKL